MKREFEIIKLKRWWFFPFMVRTIVCKDKETEYALHIGDRIVFDEHQVTIYPKDWFE